MLVGACKRPYAACLDSYPTDSCIRGNKVHRGHRCQGIDQVGAQGDKAEEAEGTWSGLKGKLYLISIIIVIVVKEEAAHQSNCSYSAPLLKFQPNSEVAGIAEYHEQFSSIVGSLTAEALLFPVETVLHRMHIQGCRTIVDNLDTGREVVPIITRYEGFIDCLTTITQEEGTRGLFKGFGALVMQYMTTFALIKLSSLVVSEIAKVCRCRRIQIL